MTWAVTLPRIGYPTPSEWDVCYFAGVPTPGVAKVKPRIPDNLDIQKPKGGKRATVKDNGDPPIQFAITLEVLPDEWRFFVDTVLPLLRPKSKDGGRPPVPFVHPQAEALNVPNVIVGPIDFGHPKSGGTMMINFTCFEWVASPAKVKAKTAPSAQQIVEAVQDIDPRDFANGFLAGVGLPFLPEF